ncbi:MAG: hypothetical protein RL199_1159, partial [Pseudomonadota bacterium]
MLLRRLLPTLLLLVACLRASPGGQSAETSDEAVVSASEAVTADDCPWGTDQCPWPGAATVDAAKGFRVGGWTEGSGKTLKVARSELLARFTMQGSAFPTGLTLSAYREGTQNGTLTVELLSDAPKYADRKVLARGRTLVSNAKATSYGELTVPMRVVAPVTRLSDGKDYWIRTYVTPTVAGAPAAVWLDQASVNIPGQLAQGCLLKSASTPAACTAFSLTVGKTLAFLPSFEGVASPSCEDRVRNGDESARDCGGSCSRRCGRNAVCRSDSDCSAATVCRPDAVGPGESDEGCADKVCTCLPKALLGEACAPGDCAEGVCQGFAGHAVVPSRCVPATCASRVKDGTETGVDCGGKCAARCGAGIGCTVTSDCDKGYICGGDGTSTTCILPKTNGSACTKDWQCASGSCLSGLCKAKGTGTKDFCETKVDCVSSICTGSRCTLPTYADKVRNGPETGTDCGGFSTSLPAGFKVCGAGSKCVVDGDCASGLACGADGLCGGSEGAPCSKATACLSKLCGKLPGGTSNVCLRAYRDNQVGHCSDGILDNDETDVDCGGNRCGACVDKKGCKANDDCQSGVCTTKGACSPATCRDGVRNGNETAVDCGGSCSKCAAGVPVPSAASCASGVRSEQGICIDGTCFDGVQNQDETAEDCGGALCPRCADTKKCAAGRDCSSGVCASATKTCAAPAKDGVKNGDETDVDCGGSAADKCALGRRCAVTGDCVDATTCVNNVCAPAQCANAVQDKTKGEVDVNCGGPCGKCATGLLCTGKGDCQSGVCKQEGVDAKKNPISRCQAPAKDDGLLNGDETMKDCGGTSGRGCAYADLCRVDADCDGGMVCTGGRCNFGECGNSTKTTAVPSCGRLCAAGCADGVACRAAVDCIAGGECIDRVCVTRKCTIGGVDYRPGQRNPENSCEKCVPDENPDVVVTTWTELSAGDVCSDGNAATHTDRCTLVEDALVCVGTPFECPDVEACIKSSAAVEDGKACEQDNDCYDPKAGPDRQKSCVNNRCEGAACIVTLMQTGYVCGERMGDCSAGGLCDGTSAPCPTSGYLAEGVVCREASPTSPCDVPETCSGQSNDCPEDASKNVGDTCSADGVDGHCGGELLLCVSCEANQYWSGTDCVPCATGSVSSGGAVTKCTAVNCVETKYWNGTACVACATGLYSPGGTATSCRACTTSEKWVSTTKKCVACPSGYGSAGGTATTCTFLDKCQTGNGGCDVNATCTNTAGATPTCACKAPYTGNGKSCAAPCVIGSRWDGSRCSPCQVGETSDGATSCRPLGCSATQFATIDSCVDAPPGQVRAGDGSYCTGSSAPMDGSDGWELVLRARWNDTDVKYTGSFWTSDTVVGTVDDPNQGKFKSPLFATLPASEVRLGMKGTDGTIRWLTFPGPRDASGQPMTLKQIFSSGTYYPLSITRGDWKGLVPGSSLQPNCNMGGFNVDPARNNAHAAVRIGFLANEQNDCKTPDSFIGLGGYVTQCDDDTSNAVGAVGIGSWACAPTDNGLSKSIRTTAYVMVRRGGQLVRKTLAGQVFDFSYIPPGTFTMGASAEDADAAADERPQHEVTLTKGFLMQRTETTQVQFRAVTGVNYSIYASTPSGEFLNRPAESLRWMEAVEFADQLSQLEGVPQGTYGLPTEAQWEYAARAGSTAPRYAAADSVAWTIENSERDETHPVRLKLPNAWSLYDTLGNVWEYNSDYYDAYGASALTDRTGPTSGARHVIRGGT